MSRLISEPPIRVEQATIPWQDGDGGQWQITASWSVLNGRVSLIGLDIRSFREAYEAVERANGRVDSVKRKRPVGDQVVELTQRVLRGISLGQVREETHAAVMDSLLRRATPGSALQGVSADDPAAKVVARRFAERAQSYTKAGEPRKRAPAAGRFELEVVARLYMAAAATSKTPAKVVEAELRQLGWAINPPPHGRDQVRQLIYRARRAGLIADPSERK